MTHAIIGGTGLDEMPGFKSGRAVAVETRFGSADVIECEMNGAPLFFLPRHGLDHSVIPGRINFRAQIAALKKLGVERAIGACAVGSLDEDIPVGSFAILGDFIDLTKCRSSTFFDEPGAPVVHTDFTEPYCPEISSVLVSACAETGVRFRERAVYVGVEGPRYESPAEIRLYASWGGDVIGMTNLPEAVLAREAGICYGAVAVVTNHAAGITPEPLSHEDVRSAMAASADDLRSIIALAIPAIPVQRRCRCGLGVTPAVPKLG